MQLEHSIPPLSKIALDICNSRTLKHNMDVMPTMRHLAIFSQTQLRMIGMAFRIPAVEVAVVLYHHIDSTHKGQTTIYYRRFLVMSHERMVQNAFVAIIEQTVDSSRFQDISNVFRVGTSLRRERIGIPEQNPDIHPFVHSTAQHVGDT